MPVSTIEQRMDVDNVNWDMTATGFGMRGATFEVIVERFEGSPTLRAEFDCAVLTMLVRSG